MGTNLRQPATSTDVDNDNQRTKYDHNKKYRLSEHFININMQGRLCYRSVLKEVKNRNNGVLQEATLEKFIDVRMEYSTSFVKNSINSLNSSPGVPDDVIMEEPTTVQHINSKRNTQDSVFDNISSQPKTSKTAVDSQKVKTILTKDECSFAFLKEQNPFLKKIRKLAYEVYDLKKPCLNAIEKLHSAGNRVPLIMEVNIEHVDDKTSNFLCHVLIEGVEVASGNGNSMKRAKLVAYEEVLKIIRMPRIEIVESDNKLQLLKGSVLAHNQNTSRHASTQPKALLNSSVEGSSQGRQSPKEQSSFDKNIHFLKRKLAHSKSLDHFIIVEQIDSLEEAAANTLKRSAYFNYMCLQYVYFPQRGINRCIVKIEGEVLADAGGRTKSAAKATASVQCLGKLKKFCWVLRMKQTVDSNSSISKEDIETEIKLKSEQIGSDCISNKLLQKIILSEIGIRKTGQGIAELVSLTAVLNLEGLGLDNVATVMKNFRKRVHEVLKSYASSENQQDLVFTNEFDVEERKVIHEECRKLNLKSVRYMKGESKYVCVSRKRSANQLLTHVVMSGGETPKYKLIPPETKSSFKKLRRSDKMGAGLHAQGISTDIDIESLRGVHENDKEWRLRKRFIEKNYKVLSPGRLVALSRCFINITMYGCLYPYSVMKEIKQRSAEILQEIKLENTIDAKMKYSASFVKASSNSEKSSPDVPDDVIMKEPATVQQINSKRNTQDSVFDNISSQPKTSKTAVDSQKVKTILTKDECSFAFLKEQNPFLKKIRKLAYEVYDLKKPCLNAIEKLHSAGNRVPLIMNVNIEHVDDKTSNFLCHVLIEGVEVASGNGNSMKRAKLVAYEEVLKIIRMPRIEIVESDNKVQLLKGSVLAHNQNTSRHASIQPKALLNSSAEGSSQGRQSPKEQSSFDKNIHCLKRKLEHSKSLDHFIIVEQIDSLEDAAANTLKRSADFNYMCLEYDFSPHGGVTRCVVKIEGEVLADAVGKTKSAAKATASVQCLGKLKKFCWVLKMKQAVDSNSSISKEEIETEIKLKSEQIGSDNIGNKLLQKMGWSGGGIGKMGQGIAEPVSLTAVLNREGLGLESVNGVSKDFRKRVHEVVKSYVTSENQEDLVFSNDFNIEERKLIHEECRKLNLKSVSRGKGENRYLCVSRKRSANQLLTHVMMSGGETAKYKLIPPEKSSSFNGVSWMKSLHTGETQTC